MSRKQLHESFLKTSYVVRDREHAIPLRIGCHEPALDRLLDHYGAASWAFITAWNPGGIEALDDAENQARNNELRRTLVAMGFEVVTGEGAGDDGEWPPEESFWIPGIGAAEALELGRRFRQAAVVVGVRGGAPELLWCDQELSR